MTETSAFPFTPMDETEEVVEGGRDRRALLLGGGVVAALALAGAGYLFLGGSDDVDDTAFVPTVTRAAQPAVKKAVPATKKVATVKVPVPFDEDLGRNPFKALYVVPAAAPAAAAGPSDPSLPQGPGTAVAVGSGTTGGTTPTTGGTSGTTSGTGTSTGGTTTTGGPTSGPTSPAAPTTREYALVLKRVYGTGKDLTAEFTIDGRKQLAKVGVRFGPTSEIRLISLQEGPKDAQWTAVLQVGDGEPFDAVTGDKVSVR